MKKDFSLKWFGIPDKVVVAFWKKLERLPRHELPIQDQALLNRIRDRKTRSAKYT